jgi:hypothetical protein
VGPLQPNKTQPGGVWGGGGVKEKIVHVEWVRTWKDLVMPVLLVF